MKSAETKNLYLSSTRALAPSTHKKHLSKSKYLQCAYTACWSQINSKKKLHPKFLQNLFFHTLIYVIQGKNFCSAIESATQNFI